MTTIEHELHFCAAPDQTQREWEESYGDLVSTNGVAVDSSSGEVVITGEFEKGIPEWNFSSTADRDGFLTKYDDSGGLVWAIQLMSQDDVVATDVAIDTTGDIFVVGYFEDSFEFEDAAGQYIQVQKVGLGIEIFVLAFDDGGTHQWDEVFGGDGTDRAYGVTSTAEAEKLFVTGEFEQTAVFDSQSLTSNGGSDAFLVSMNKSNGSVTDASGFGDTSDDIGYEVAVSEAVEQLYLTGTYEGPADFGGGALPTWGDKEIVVAAYDWQLQHQWSDGFGNRKEDVGFGIEANKSRVTFTGRFEEEVDFGGGTFVANDVDAFAVTFDDTGSHQWSEQISRTQEDVFLVKYDENGSHQWHEAFQHAGSTQEEPEVATDASDNVYFLVTTDDQIDLGGGTVPGQAVGDFDSIVTKFDANGNHQWDQPITGAAEEFVSFDVDDSGNVYVAGTVADGTETVEVDGTQVSGNTPDDEGFVFMLDDSGNYQWHQELTGVYDHNNGRPVLLSSARPSGGAVVLATPFVNTTYDFGCGNNPSSFDADAIVVAVYDDNGNCDWMEKFDGDTGGDERPFDASLLETTDSDPDEYDLYVLAQSDDDVLNSSSDWPFSDVTNEGGLDSLVFKIEVDSTPTNYHWATGLGGSGDDEFQSLAVTPDEKVLVGGYYDGDPDYGDGTLPAPPSGETNSSVVRLEQQNGDTIWSEAFDTSKIQSVDAYDACQIAFGGDDGDGNSIDFGGGPENVESFAVSFTP